jgi:capsular polysaccharide biosynthesis protein
MELRLFLQVLRRWWWLVVTPGAIALLLTLPALPMIVSPPRAYQAVIRFTASQPPTEAQTFEDQSYIPWLASEYAVNYLAGWARTESFATEIARQLAVSGQPIDASAIQAAINADAVRSIMTLYVSTPDPDLTQLIAAAAQRTLIEQNARYVPQFAAQPAQITALDSITVDPVSAPITNRLSPLLRVLIGLAVGFGLAFLADYLDPTIRGRREAEMLLGAPIIAEIPPHK